MMTQRELADAAGVSAQTVADFERGARTPHHNNLRAIRLVLELRGLQFVENGGRLVAINFSAVEDE
ncbi:MAG: helix-turn-helix domain-containing protein [Proteobacteria bacterium]|jgi:transcriptional regulator with XRE-family HTH domain|nr:helix-turn-helix domain-containing protein [Pseudomonadota bacterium]